MYIQANTYYHFIWNDEICKGSCRIEIKDNS